MIFLWFISSLVPACKETMPAESEMPRGVFVDKIAFTSWHFSTNQAPTIAVADLYESSGKFALYDKRDLTDGVAASMSDDRKWIAYLHVKNGIHLMRINVDGAEKKEILFPDDLAVQGVRISPDGNVLAVIFQSIHHYNGLHLGIIGSTGGALRTLYADSSWSFMPDWSPDGRRVYFSWADMNNRYGHNIPRSIRVKSYIVEVNIDGTNWQPVSDTLRGLSNDSSPAVSADGKQIVFISQRNFPDNIFPEIFIMDNDGRNVRQMTQCVGCQRHGDHFDYYTMDNAPRWIKDNKHIIFQRDSYNYNHSTKQYTQEQDLYLMSIDGPALQNLTNDGASSLLK
jgi:Tol biopolymer transport system component